MTRLSDNGLTDGGLLGTAGYKGGKGTSEGIGTGVNLVDETAVEPIVIELVKASVTTGLVVGMMMDIA
jgi:hypothetical protein